MSDDVPTPASDPSSPADEIRQLISLRSRRSARDGHFPSLEGLLPEDVRDDPDQRFVALTQLIDTAIAAMDDPAHRQAAAALVGSGPDRWAPVTRRGAKAAAAFGCGWDAYRRRRASGTSQLDDTIDALVTSLTNPGTGEPPTPDPSRPTIATVVLDPAPGHTPDAEVDLSGNQPDGSPTSRTRSTRLLLAGGAAALTLAIAVLALTTIGGSKDPSSPDNPRRAGSNESGTEAICSRLNHEVGDTAPSADEELKAWSRVFIEAARDLPDNLATCAGLLTRDLGVVLQPVSDNTDNGIGALVGVEGDHRRAVFLYNLEYWVLRKYHEAYGSVLGTPIARADRPDGTRIVKLTAGVIVGGPHENVRAVYGASFAEWTRRGGPDGEMGLPISAQRDVTGTGKVQDYEHGRVTVDFQDPSRVTWEAVDNPASLLPPNIANHILTADDGSSWWIDSDNVRHWIPTGHDYVCATGPAGSEVVTAPIIAVATLEIGEPLRCR